ncbi:MAG: hypothetical protein AB8F94_14435 [Saprospiraceae bacterium]
MNNKIFSFLLFIFFTISANAQIDGISYQAVIIDNNPQEIPGVDIPASNLPNASLEVRFTIINNNGIDEYQETHKTETDPFGMINLMIGQGDVSGGTANQFNQIYWSDDKTLIVEIDLEDGNGFIPFSEQSLTYIPYVKHREIVATSTLDVDGETNLNNTLNVNNGSTTTLTGDLYVEGTAYFTDGEFQNLIVHQNTNLNLLNVDGISNFNNNVNVTQSAATNLSGTLNVDGISTLNNNLTVTANSPTTLSGTLDVDGKTNINNELFVNDEFQTQLSGQLTVDGITNHNNQVIIDAEMPNSSQSEYLAYPLRVQGGQQGIAIQLNPDDPSRSNNYISFWGGTGEVKGRIEGNNGLTGIGINVVQATIGQVPGIGDIIDAIVDEDQPAPNVAANDYFVNEYAFGAYNLTLDFVMSIIRFGINAAAASGACVTGDCDDAIWSFMDMTVDGIQLGGYITYNELNLGVAFESGGADYAEFLEKVDHEELMTLGDVVGMKGGRVSKTFIEAERFMVVSANPMISGAMPDTDKEYLYERIAFMGQVPVKVMGKVNRGDYILPSGNGEGMAIAVNPNSMKTGDYARIVGVAWSDYDGDDLFSFINTAVGLNTNDLVGVVEQMQQVINQMQIAIAETNKNYDPAFFENNSAVPSVQNNQTTAASLNDQLKIDFQGKSLEQIIKENKSILTEHNFDFSLFPLLEETLDNPTKENLDQLVVYYSSVLEHAKKMNPRSK